MYNTLYDSMCDHITSTPIATQNDDIPVVMSPKCAFRNTPPPALIIGLPLDLFAFLTLTSLKVLKTTDNTKVS